MLIIFFQDLLGCWNFYNFNQNVWNRHEIVNFYRILYLGILVKLEIGRRNLFYDRTAALIISNGY